MQIRHNRKLIQFVKFLFTLAASSASSSPLWLIKDDFSKLNMVSLPKCPSFMESYTWKTRVLSIFLVTTSEIITRLVSFLSNSDVFNFFWVGEHNCRIRNNFMQLANEMVTSHHYHQIFFWTRISCLQCKNMWFLLEASNAAD